MPNYLNFIAVDLVDLYRERLGKFLDIVGMSLSGGGTVLGVAVTTLSSPPLSLLSG